MKPKFRAWSKTEKIMSDVKKLDFWNGEIDARSFEETEIEEVVLMQSTGLKDKNGKEIFEGDIVRNGTDVADIKRHPTLGFYTVVNGKEGFFGDGMSIDDFEEDAEEFSEIIEIIGNIYENPELLK